MVGGEGQIQHGMLYVPRGRPEILARETKVDLDLLRNRRVCRKSVTKSNDIMSPLLDNQPSSRRNPISRPWRAYFFLWPNSYSDGPFPFRRVQLSHCTRNIMSTRNSSNNKEQEFYIEKRRFHWDVAFRHSGGDGSLFLAVRFSFQISLLSWELPASAACASPFGPWQRVGLQAERVISAVLPIV